MSTLDLRRLIHLGLPHLGLRSLICQAWTSPGSPERPADTKRRARFQGVTVGSPGHREQRAKHIHAAAYAVAKAAADIYEIHSGNAIVLSPQRVVRSTNWIVVGNFQPVCHQLRKRECPDGQAGAENIPEFAVKAIAVRSNVHEFFRQGVGVLSLKVDVAKMCLETMSNRKSHSHLPSITADSGVGEMLVIGHGIGPQDEWSQHERPRNQPIAQPHTKVLQAAVKIPVINGEQMGRLAIVDPHTDGNGNRGGELIGNTKVNTVDQSKEGNMAGVYPRPIAQSMLGRIEVLEYDGIFAFPLRRSPCLPEARGADGNG